LPLGYEREGKMTGNPEPTTDSRETSRAGGNGQAPRTATPLLGDSLPMQRLRSQIDLIARRNCTVLIHGETGAGKELVARAIHAASRRSVKPIIPIDCTGLHDSLFDSQLFGHVRGAFTGAQQATLGFFRAADGGSVFLDEIGELEPLAQSKLLRCLQERAVVPLGAIWPIPVNVRVMAATHRDLREMVRAGKFRLDLFYRLGVVILEVPPLRRRAEDIEMLSRHFLEELSHDYQEPLKQLTPAAIAKLKRHAWPGNVRELSNAIEHAFVFCRTPEIDAADLPIDQPEEGKSSVVDLPILSLAESERKLILHALQATGGNRTQAARLLAIERHRLHRKITLYGLSEFTKP
jgi:two-component system response regulator HydG